MAWSQTVGAISFIFMIASSDTEFCFVCSSHYLWMVFSENAGCENYLHWLSRCHPHSSLLVSYFLHPDVVGTWLIDSHCQFGERHWCFISFFAFLRFVEMGSVIFEELIKKPIDCGILLLLCVCVRLWRAERWRSLPWKYILILQKYQR